MAAEEPSGAVRCDFHAQKCCIHRYRYDVGLVSQMHGAPIVVAWRLTRTSDTRDHNEITVDEMRRIEMNSSMYGYVNRVILKGQLS